MTDGQRATAKPGANRKSLLELTFPGEGEMSTRCRALDWGATALGPVETWPQSLRTIVATLLSAKNPMFLWWGPDLIQFYNDAYRPSFGSGHRNHKALGAQGRPFWHDIWDIIGPEIEQVMSTGAATWHEDAFIPIERDGGLADVWWTYGYSPAFDDDGSIGGTLVVCQETTARVASDRARDQVVRALATERGRLAAIFDNAPSALAVFTGDDHVYDRVNPAFREITGGRDVVGKPLFEVFPELRGQGLDVALDAVRATGTPFIGRQVPFSYAAQAGGTPAVHYFDLVFLRLTEANGSHSLVAHLIEVTDQVHAVETLREAEQRLHEQFAKMPMPTSLWERAGDDFVLIGANEASDLVAPGLGAKIGSLRADLFPGTDHITAECLRCLREDVVAKMTEEMDFGPLAGRRHIEFSIGPQQPNRILIHSIDITEKIVLEAALRKAQRMESVGLLAGGIAHDFNNALTVIGAHSGFLLESLGAHDSARADLQAITEATSRAAGLTRQLLAFSRKQILQPTYVNANDIVENLSGMLRGALGTDITIETTLSPDTGIICIDASQLEQAITNLVLNAADAMPQGGTLAICTKRLCMLAGHADTGEAVAPGDYLCVEVRDSGIGMSEVLRARAFEPFYGWGDEAEGQGMGLATVYGIVAQSGGHVTLESEPGQGTTARMLFPVVAAQEPAPARSSTPAATTAEPRANHESILLIEDEPGVRLIAKRILTGAGYKVFEAAGGPAGVEVSDDVTIRLHMVLSDIVMPGMGGAEVVERVRARRPGIRAGVMSGYTDDEVMRRGIRESGVAFLQKPFTAAQLTQFVRMVLDAPAEPESTEPSTIDGAAVA